MTNHDMDDTLQSLIWLEIQDGHHLKILFIIEACKECFYGDQESKMAAGARHSITW